jgi:hypothetical protein
MPASPPKGLQSRLFVLVVLAFLPAVALYWYANRELRAAERSAHERELLRAAQVVSVEYQRLIDESRALLGSLTEVPAIRDARRPECGRILAGVLQHTPHYTTVSLIGGDGNLVCGSLAPGDPLYLGDREYFLRARSLGRFAVGEYAVGRITGRPGVGVAFPLMAADGTPDRVLAASIDLTMVGRNADRLELPEGASLTVVDRSGRVLVRRSPGPAPIQADSVGALKPASFPDAPENFQPAIVEGEDLDGTPRTFAVLGLRSEGVEPAGYLAIGKRTNEMVAAADRTAGTKLGLLTGGAIAALLLAWFFGHYTLVRPVMAEGRT